MPGHDAQPVRGVAEVQRADRREQRRRRRAAAVARPPRRTPPRHGHIAARTPLEQQQLDGQHQCGERRVERCRHASRGAGNQQRLAFVCSQAQELREQRSDRTAGHDDRTLGAERPAGADGDRRRHRFEYGDSGLDPAAAEQDRFDRLRHPVTADLLRSVAGHQADHQTTGHRVPTAAAGCGARPPGATSRVPNRP